MYMYIQVYMYMYYITKTTTFCTSLQEVVVMVTKYMSDKLPLTVPVYSNFTTAMPQQNTHPCTGTVRGSLSMHACT